MFEKEPTCGGHTLTDSTAPVPVDLGFQVRYFFFSCGKWLNSFGFENVTAMRHQSRKRVLPDEHVMALHACRHAFL